MKICRGEGVGEIRLSGRLAILILAIVGVFFLYLPGLSGGFFFDDYPNIVNNEAVHVSDIDSFSLHSVLAGPEAGPLGRPVSVISFALTHYFFGLDPYFFKLCNLLLHALNGVVLYTLMNAIFKHYERLNGSRSYWVYLPLVVTVAWLVHPINVVAVLMSVQRMAILAATFSLFALFFHVLFLKSTGVRAVLFFLVSWFVFWPLACLSKESALLLPLYGMLLVWLSDKRAVSFKWGLIGLAIIASVVGIWGISRFGGWLLSAYEIRDFTLAERLMTQSRVVWFYVFQIVLPQLSLFGLYLDDFQLSKGVFSPVTTLLSIFAWCSLIGVALALRNKSPLFLFGVFWFLIGHLLESTIIPLEIAFEHRNYFASIGVLVVFFVFFGRAIEYFSGDKVQLTLTLTGFVFVFYLGVLTWIRSDHFSDPLRFSMLEAAYHPASPRANLVAATAMMDAGYGADQDFASHAIRFHLLKSIELDQHGKAGYFYLILWSCATGRVIESSWVDDLTYRMSFGHYSLFERGFVFRLQRLVISAPNCISRQDVERMFIGAATNARISLQMRSKMLEALSDYELVVWKDVASALKFAEKGLLLSPYDDSIKKKIDSYRMIKDL